MPDRLHVLLNLKEGVITFEAATNADIEVTIIDWDVEGDRPNIMVDHWRKVITPEKMDAVIENIRRRIHNPFML